MTSTQAALCILVHKDRGRLVAGIRQADAGANCETQHQVIVGFSQGDASSRAGCRHYRFAPHLNEIEDRHSPRDGCAKRRVNFGQRGHHYFPRRAQTPTETSRNECWQRAALLRPIAVSTSGDPRLRYGNDEPTTSVRVIALLPPNFLFDVPRQDERKVGLALTQRRHRKYWQVRSRGIVTNLQGILINRVRH